MISQILIGVLGTLAVWLVNSPNPRSRRWAPVAGLISQPFWFAASIATEQWGIFFLSVVYTFGWLRGLHTYWSDPDA